MKPILKKRLQIIGIATGIGLFVVVGTLIAIPLFFKKPLLEKLKTEINKNVKATVNFDDVHLSLLRSFPNLNLRLDALEVVGLAPFDGLRLAGVEQLEVVLNLSMLWKPEEPIQIRKINLRKPNIYVKVLRDGTANYDITLPMDSVATVDTSATTAFSVQLKSYQIKDANIVYDDASADIFAEIKNLDHSGKGDFTEKIFELTTKTEAQSVTLKFGGVGYLSEAEADIDLNLLMDNKAQVYTFKENSIRLNDLRLNFDGSIGMPNTTDIVLDLKFDSPDTDFKSLLSMVPGAYASNFKGVKAGGTMTFNGFTKGIYNAKMLPAFEVNLQAKNGSFKYPDLPIGVSDVEIALNIKSPDENLDNIIVSLSKFHLLLDQNAFDANLLVKNPMTDPYIESNVKGNVNLGSFASAFPLKEQGVEKLSGWLRADFATKTRMSYVTSAAYDKVVMSGKLGLENMIYKGEGLPEVVINRFNTDFTPQQVDIQSFSAKLGQSDFAASGRFDNVLMYFSGTQTLKGNVTMRSERLDLNEWMSGAPVPADENAPTALITDTTQAADDLAGDLLDRFDFQVDVQMKSIDYDAYKVRDLNAVGHLTPTLIDLQKCYTKVNSSDFELVGRLENAIGYAMKGDMLKGNLKLVSTFINADELMAASAPAETTESTVKTSSAEPAVLANANEVFGRFDLDTDVDIKKIKYDIYDITDLKVVGKIANDRLEIVTAKTNVGKSDFAVSGTVNDYFEYLYSKGTVNGDVTLYSKFMDADELAGTATTTTTTTTETSAPTPIEGEVFGKFDFDLNVKIDAIKYDVYDIKNLRAVGEAKHDVIRVDDFGMMLGKSDLQGKGVISNAINYLFKGESLQGDLSLSSNFFDLNPFMVATETAAPATPPSDAPLEPIVVPNNVEMNIQADFKQILYAKVKANAVNGKLTIKDSQVSMQDLSAEVFEGKMKMDGSYNTKDPKKPVFAFAYDVSSFSIKEAFAQLNTIKAIAPIAAYIDGKFNSTLSLTGILGSNMMPVLNSINSTGLLETINAVVKNYPPLNSVSEKLSLKEVQDWEIKNIKSYFEIKDGTVEIKPFDVNVKDIAMNIGGTHSLAQDMNYVIKMSIPRELLEKTKATATVNTGISLLSQQAGKLGISIADGAYINADVLLKGSIKQPKVEVKLKGTSGERTVKEEAKDQIEGKKEEATATAKAAADSIKAAAEQKAKQQVGAAKDKANEKVEEAKDDIAKKLEEEKNKLKDQAKEQAGQVTDKLGDKAKEELDKVGNKVGEDVKTKVGDKAKEEVDKLKELNPFKKKKEENN